MAKKRTTVVRRIDCTLDKQILEVKDLVDASTGKPIQYKDASKLLALNIKNPSLHLPLKTKKRGGLFDDIL